MECCHSLYSSLSWHSVLLWAPRNIKLVWICTETMGNQSVSRLLRDRRPLVYIRKPEMVLRYTSIGAFIVHWGTYKAIMRVETFRAGFGEKHRLRSLKLEYAKPSQQYSHRIFLFVAIWDYLMSVLRMRWSLISTPISQPEVYINATL